jgi:hypothetical protein
MDAVTQAHVTFFLTGRRTGDLAPVEGLDLRPALAAGYRDLTDLRYDFPMVLVSGPGDEGWAQSLSGLFDTALDASAHDGDADRIRHHGLRMEREMRALVAGGATGPLSACWDVAVSRLEPHAESSFADSLRRIRSAMKVEGDVVDCDAELPARAIRHAWSAVQARKADALRATIDRLVLKLTDILKADVEHSSEGRAAPRLKASMGATFSESFDFDEMSRVLGTARTRSSLPDSRRRRIHELLAVLESQPFVPRPSARTGAAGAAEPLTFVFNSCAETLEAFRGRMPRLAELARAVAIGELEVDGQYREARHDALFEQFGANGLDLQDLALYPDYLVIVNAAELQAVEQARLMEILSSGLPIKVLLQIDDILEESPHGHLTTGVLGRQIASMAMGLNEVYVLQASASHLLRFREHILRGLRYRGPAFFSVFSGASGAASGLPPYLVAAAATESRAFPAFAYDPGAGPDWATRFSLGANPQVDLDWPIQPFPYEDDQHQRVSEDLAFTMIDFIASDRRYARHLARVPRAQWHAGLVPVDESLSRERRGLPDEVPSLLMVDREDRLHRVIVDERLIREARRCRETWHSLQELGGIHNSHAEALVARERRAWEARLQPDVGSPAVVTGAGAVGAAPPASVAAAALPEAEPRRSPDEAYIETERCSTCNECTTINNRMFAYNGNKQAYIVDVSAGTYAQLVEAAESCQVSVIHPGRPRNANEPGLEELLKRAAPFL